MKDRLKRTKNTLVILIRLQETRGIPGKYQRSWWNVLYVIGSMWADLEQFQASSFQKERENSLLYFRNQPSAPILSSTKGKSHVRKFLAETCISRGNNPYQKVD